MFPLPRGAK